MSNYVPSAVATLVISDGRLLLGRRIKKQQFEGWQCPGGFMQIQETVEEASKRCCLNKAGIHIADTKEGPYTNNIFSTSDEITHSITLYVIAKEYQVIDVERFSDNQVAWTWFDFDKIPSQRFLPLDQLLKSYDLASLISL